MAPGHFTASAFVLSPERERLLLIHHGKLKRWLQPGGHIDAEDADVVQAALREVEEETGVREPVLLPGSPVLLDLDIHRIPPNPRKGEGEHEHFDVRFLFQARDEAMSAGSDAMDARWVGLDEVESWETDDSVLRAVTRIRAMCEAWKAPETALCSPAVARNREPILEVLTDWVPAGAGVLEVASGTGEHARYLSRRLDIRSWQPTDISRRSLLSIDAHRGQEVGGRLQPAMRLDVLEPRWHVSEADVIFCANMIHISAWDCTLGLLDGAARTLPLGGRLILYGPFRMGGRHTAESNRSFDESLRARDASWGVRDLEAVVTEAARRGLHWARSVAMPANNMIVIFER